MVMTRVLVVDDSITMRALFTSALESSGEIVVVNAASSADQARAMIAQNRPDVLTLDVEMPGMNGLDFLAELMRDNPIPVVMLSTLTQIGADTSLKAMELGAIDCFPKPVRSTPDEFERISEKLCKLVIAAARSRLRLSDAPKGSANVLDASQLRSDGIIALSASTGGIEAYLQLLAGFPADCPPTIILQQLEHRAFNLHHNRLL
jgi:two-component system, chemotaxis family, protein-glutamate methylesterase/glutaminase